MNTLLLNADFQPLKVLSWQQAMVLVLEGHVDLVEPYKSEVRSAYTSHQRPAVVRLRRYVKPTGRVRFNRSNLLARDRYTCAYCGEKRTHDKLTMDHVIPRAQSKNGFVHKDGKTIGVTCWENVVAACDTCNYRKADRTPEQAGMKLLRQPRLPTQADVMRMSLVRVKCPPEWSEYIKETG